MLRKILKIIAVLLAIITIVSAISWLILKDQLEVMNAVIDEDREIISYYIDEKGFNPNDMYGRYNLIHYYLALNESDIDLEFIKFLIDKGVSPNKLSDKWMSPLTYAIAQHHLDVVALLIKNGADVNETIKNGMSPLDASLNIFDCRIAEVLINNNASLKKEELREKLLERIKECNIKN